MANNDIIPAPGRSSINTGLTTPDEAFMVGLFGPPGTRKPTNCDNSVITPRFKAHVVSMDVGPFTAQGFKLAVESLKKIFEEALQAHPHVLEGLKNDGMLCIRKRRTNSKWSNHAFGCAIDLRYPTAVHGYEDGVPQGDAHTFQGLLDLYPFFHKEGWYWGAGYRGSAIDAMHFEPSVQLLTKWKDQSGPF